MIHLPGRRQQTLINLSIPVVLVPRGGAAARAASRLRAAAAAGRGVFGGAFEVSVF